MRVRVPASIANLGPGFDVLAMAVDLWLEAEARPADRPQWKFDGAQPPGSNPFAELAMKGRVKSRIPLGVGLGSSAAARVAALRLAGFQGAALLERAAAAEGHPDNVAAAIHGGVVAIVDGRVHHLPPPDLEVALFVAGEPSPTEEARAILPATVDRTDAVHNAGRLALLVHALHSRDWSLLRAAMDDRLHQPARTALYPWLPEVIAAGYSAGAWGVALSGAGPSVFALSRRGTGRMVAAAMTAAAGMPGSAMTTRIAVL
ncbi:MAG: homoserine kinase [Candidatus Dormibacteraceae bacterium]